MKRTLVLIALLGSACTGSAGENGSTDASPGLSCARTPGAIVIRFGLTKPPTFFAVETPTGQFIYLRHPPRQVDYLGAAYFEDPLILDLESTTGALLEGASRSEARVFTAAGTYALRFRDANHVAGEQLHMLTCNVEVEAVSGSQRLPAGT